MGRSRWGLGITCTLIIFICLFLLTLPYTCLVSGNLTPTICSEQERLALLKFKHSVKDDSEMLSSWGVGTDCCRWERVGCDDATGRVVSLQLRGNIISIEDYVVDAYYLVGDELNSCLTELVNLNHLDLSGNYFHKSRIPEFIGSFKQLRYLNLSGLGFSGNIPHQIGNLSNLKVLDLSSLLDRLKIDDMAWISGLSKLEQLRLSGVDLSRTQNLHNLFYPIPHLSKLSLSMCGLSMAHLGFHHLNSSRELASINHLDLGFNDFGGQLPGLFLNMTSLAFLDLSCGSPVSRAWSLGNLLSMIPSVSELHLLGCGLQKVNISPTNLNFSTSSNIQHLDLNWNEIEGRFPSALTNMSSLLSLDMSNNKLNSSIPVMPNLLKLDISFNELRQIEDVGIWRQCHLKELIVSYNNLEGELIGPSTNVSKCSQYALEVLYLDQNTLSCTIPESLRRLTNLRDLDLSSNELTGPIPESLGRLTNLIGLDLSSNQLTGPIPETLAKLRSLQGLYLSYNELNGSLPDSLGRLTSLRQLILKSNQFTGPIPDSIGQLTKLLILEVSENSLHGLISKNHFANLSKIKYLNVGDNNKLIFNISREWIPPFQLNVLRLGSCKIEGGFPQWLRTQRVLRELVLSNASLYGPLPTWLHLMPKIKFLDLSHNKLTGPLTNLPPSVMVLFLQHNLFRGLIPRWLCAYLSIVDLSKNRLSGKIPTCMWNISMLVMILSSNRISGVIPGSLGHSDPSLEWLQLNDNNFNGELPHEFEYFKSLIVLDLGENKISGNIPEWIGENLSDLVALRLHKNNFTGQIPHSLCKRRLHVLDLAHNNLTGSIPHCFGELDAMKENFPILNNMLGDLPYNIYGNMTETFNGIALAFTKTLQFMINIDLSSNKLVGEIPEAITTLDALEGLNLCNNNFTGGIPKNIGNMKSLISLDLSVNELSGMIPPSMTALNFLSYLNLSHNNLSGQIPTGNQLQTLTDHPSIYADNPYLCGAPLPKECSPHEKPPTTTRKNKHKNANEPNKVWFYLDITCGFATGFWGIIGVLLLKKQWRHKLFLCCEETMDKIYVVVVVRVSKLKRGREGAQTL